MPYHSLKICEKGFATVQPFALCLQVEWKKFSGGEGEREEFWFRLGPLDPNLYLSLAAVADAFSLHHIYHLLSYIGGMVAHPLQVAHDINLALAGNNGPRDPGHFLK